MAGPGRGRGRPGRGRPDRGAAPGTAPRSRPGRGASPTRPAATPARRPDARRGRSTRVVAGASVADLGSGRTAIAQTPIGCQTVFISRKAAIHSGRSVARSSSQSKRASATVVGRREQALDVVGGERARSRSAWRPGRPRCRGHRRPRGRRGPGRAPACSPVRTLTTPPGTSDVARTSLSVTAGQRPRLRRHQHDRVARDERRREPADEAQQRRGLGRDDADDAGRLGDREVEVRRGDRVGRAQDLGDLVGPAGVPDPAVDGPVHDARGRRRRAAPRRPTTSATNWSRRPSISSATR